MHDKKLNVNAIPAFSFGPTLSSVCLSIVCSFIVAYLFFTPPHNSRAMSLKKRLGVHFVALFLPILSVTCFVCTVSFFIAIAISHLLLDVRRLDSDFAWFHLAYRLPLTVQMLHMSKIATCQPYHNRFRLDFHRFQTELNAKLNLRFRIHNIAIWIFVSCRFYCTIESIENARAIAIAVFSMQSKFTCMRSHAATCPFSQNPFGSDYRSSYRSSIIFART